MCINAFFLEISVLSFEIPQWRVFFSTPQHEMNEMSRALKKAWGEWLVTCAPGGKFALIRLCGHCVVDYKKILQVKRNPTSEDARQLCRVWL